MIRPLVALTLLVAVAAGCGGSSHSASPTPTLGVRTETIPRTSPVPVETVKGLPTVNPHTTPVKLPTTKPILATPVPIPASAYTARIYGRITDAKTHAPLAGAIVTVGTGRKHRAVTGPLGKYSLAFPKLATVAVTVNKKGYLGYLAVGKLHNHESYRLDVALQRRLPGAAPAPPGIFGH
jgi:hypothetical protein